MPVEREEVSEGIKPVVEEESKEVIKEKKKAELVKQMSLSTTDGGGNDNGTFNWLPRIQYNFFSSFG